MKDRPIIFSSEMVKAILDGRKTMTRRVVRPQPYLSADGNRWGWEGKEQGIDLPLRWILSCPFQVGQHLWVRETWQHNPYGGIVHRAGSGIMDCDGRGWKSPIFMPRWASRITLEITAVRVERVQDITPLDCESEGIIGVSKASPVRGQPYEEYQNGDGLIYVEPRGALQSLWDSLNAKRGYGWDANPWVWVISFRRL